MDKAYYIDASTTYLLFIALSIRYFISSFVVLKKSFLSFLLFGSPKAEAPPSRDDGTFTNENVQNIPDHAISVLSMGFVDSFRFQVRSLTFSIFSKFLLEACVVAF